ncbi:MAG: Gfo/Idh/MocA family protein [Candidatus Aminicenantales bacterium]
MADKIRWGILSTGNIAASFARGLRAVPGAELVAVGSRSRDTAERFGRRFDIPHRHPSYEALAGDPDVDVIYVGTPHNLHHDNTLCCLEAGKSVLCEKPFAINEAQAGRMIAEARKRKLFLMEAMWTRFLPASLELRKMVTEGIIGDVQMIEASFGFRADLNPAGRLFNPALGGGALLDIGIYPISFAYRLLGPPNRITGLADIGSTGVDERSGVILGYPNGALAVLHFSLTTDMPSDALVMGTKGRIKVHAPIYRPDHLTLIRRALPGPNQGRWTGIAGKIGRSRALSPIRKHFMGRGSRTLPFPLTGNGYNYEAAEVGNRLKEGKIESEVMPLDETLDIMRTMDRIRAQWGLKYPGE